MAAGKHARSARDRRATRRRKVKRFFLKLLILLLMLLLSAGAVLLIYSGFSRLPAIIDTQEPKDESHTGEMQPADNSDSGTHSDTNESDTPDPEATAALPQQSVVSILQRPELPTGCESTAATMLLRSYGYTLEKTDFATALPKVMPAEINGKVYAPHPDAAFIGNPFSTAGFGVFPPTVVSTMQQFIDRENGQHVAVNITGADEAAILAHLDRGAPVCIWTTINLLPVVGCGGWFLLDGDTQTDMWFDFPGNEHCVVLTGYTDETVSVCDPWKGSMTYDRTRFFERYAAVGRRAIILRER